MCTCECMCSCVPIWMPEVDSGVVHFLDKLSVLWWLESIQQAVWVYLHLCSFTNADITDIQGMPGFYMNSSDLNSGPRIHSEHFTSWAIVLFSYLSSFCNPFHSVNRGISYKWVNGGDYKCHTGRRRPFRIKNVISIFFFSERESSRWSLTFHFLFLHFYYNLSESTAPVCISFVLPALLLKLPPHPHMEWIFSEYSFLVTCDTPTHTMILLLNLNF